MGPCRYVEPSADLDPFDLDFIACPFPPYHELRDLGPAVHLPHGKGFWFVSAHELVKEVVGDVERFSSESGPLAASIPSPEALARMAELTPPTGMPGRTPTLLTLDPPGHTRNRRLIARAFTPASVRRYEDLTREICRELITAWRDDTEIDVVASFTVPLPVRVIARALDVPDDRVEDFKRWSDASVGAIGADLSDDEWVGNHRLLLDLAAFIQDQIDRKREPGPATDVMSSLVHAELSDDEVDDIGGSSTRRQLADDEIQSIVRQLIVAGNETTTNLLTQLLVLFADETHWWRAMQDDPGIIPAVVEEGLRMFAPSAVNQRATACPVDFHGVSIPEGDVVLIGYLAANHDPAVFRDPERFDPTRDNLGEHLAFGRGIHFCPGAALARMEARVALEELTAAVATYDIGDRGQIPWNRSFQLRAMRSVPFSPRLTIRR